MPDPAPLPYQSGVKIGNASLPAEGPKAIPYNPDFSILQSYVIDLTYLYQQKLLSVVQCLWIDASNATLDVTVALQGTGQVIRAPKGSQGYYPVLSPGGGKILVSSAGGVVPIFILNIPMSALGGWADAPALIFDVAGNLKTADQLLAPLITTAAGQTSPGLDVNIIGGGSANGTQYHPFNFSTTNLNGINQTVVNYFNTIYINSWEIWLSADAQCAAAEVGEIELYDTSVGNLVWQGRIAVPGAAPASPFGRGQLISRMTDVGYKGQTNGVFRFGGSIGANLTVGSLEIFGTYADI